MKEKDIFEEIITLGTQRGVLTYDEINEALPTEFFSPDELENLMDTLSDKGVKVVDYGEGVIGEDEVEEEVGEYERAEDLVQAYFNSMGDISILSRDGEIDLAKKLEQGREIINGIATELPLFDKIKIIVDTEDEEGITTGEERADKALIKTLSRLEELIDTALRADVKIKKYSTLKDFRSFINEKKKKGQNTNAMTCCLKRYNLITKRLNQRSA